MKNKTTPRGGVKKFTSSMNKRMKVRGYKIAKPFKLPGPKLMHSVTTPLTTVNRSN